MSVNLSHTEWHAAGLEHFLARLQQALSHEEERLLVVSILGAHVATTSTNGITLDDMVKVVQFFQQPLPPSLA